MRRQLGADSDSDVFRLVVPGDGEDHDAEEQARGPDAGSLPVELALEELGEHDACADDAEERVQDADEGPERYPEVPNAHRDDEAGEDKEQGVGEYLTVVHRLYIVLPSKDLFVKYD